MAFALRVMGNLTDGPDGDLQDKLFEVIRKVARPA